MRIRLSSMLALLTFGSVAGVLLLTMAICFYQFYDELNRIALENQSMRIKVFKNLLAAKGSEFKIQDGNLLVGDYVINNNFELPDRLKELCGGTATIFMNDTRVSTNVLKPDGSRAVGTKLQGTAYDAVFKEGKAYQGEADILGTKYFTSYEPIKNSLNETIGVIYTGVKKDEFFASYYRLITQLAVWIIIITACTALGVFVFIKLVITGPIQEIQGKFSNMSRGDLTVRLHTKRSDEIGDLAKDFNSFIAGLEAMLFKIRHVAITLKDAIHEVASGSQGLSQTTQGQASAIEQVAATIEEMTSSIKLNATNADQGNAKAKSMVETANAGSEDSQQLMKAMEEISTSSRKIGDIISTVNEVAFQTNLLALNASVEAARAGEHGKGFAVVAEEVRSLAQRSADAARQIKVLIEDSVRKVTVGDALVKKSGESLGKMIGYIEDLSKSINEIAASSAEQATGVDEVNRALSQIDSSTQQNASTVDQLAKVSVNLSSEAEDLTEMIDHFKVSQKNNKK